MPKQSMNNKKPIIFTDLDGTLLDHFDYSHSDAKACLDRLISLEIPIIPNTSKTFAEVLELRQLIGLDGPFVIENGAAVIIPNNFFPLKPRDCVWKDGFWIKTFSPKRAHWLGLVQKLKPEFGQLFEAFNDMTLQRIIELTGLTETEATLSSQRQFGEPLLWCGNDEELKKFTSILQGFGARPVSGGRFLHVCGDCSKGKALTWLVNEYQRQHNNIPICSIALGDGNNDVSMLEEADIAVRIASPTHEPPILNRETDLYTSEFFGPKGWAEVLDQLIPETTDSSASNKQIK
ncbi:HAD-IIB family hydrolase [Glaciecola sp. MF2-115]|uniref:HAD-IIB family hydrolase n=1 Tax=Glaciecola sp. MF2-115 TaxID=3384827 RepID=UPI0039A039B9